MNIKLVKDICALLDEKKASDIVIVDATNMKNVVDYFIICTASSTTHIRALSDYIENYILKNENLYDGFVKEGLSTSEWVVVDLGDIFVHIFTERERNHFNLDKLLNEGKNILTYKRLLTLIEKEEKRIKQEKENKQKKELKEIKKEEKADAKKKEKRAKKIVKEIEKGDKN